LCRYKGECDRRGKRIMELERLLLSMKKREDIISQEVMEEKKRSEDLESRNDREVAKRLRSEKMVEDERERREELEGVLQQERKRMSHIMMSSPTQDNEGGENNDLMIANINRKYQEESPSSSNYQFHYPIQPTNSSTSPPSQQHQHRSPIQHHHQDEITPQRYSPSPSSSSGSNNSQPSPSTYDEFSPSSQDI